MVAIAGLLAPPGEMLTAALPRKSSSAAHPPPAGPDVFVSFCHSDPLQAVPAAKLAELKQRARPFIECAVNQAYQYFPIKRPPLAQQMLDQFVTPRVICNAVAPLQSPPADLDQERERYRGNELVVDDARQRGLSMRRLPVEIDCATGERWAEPQHYNNVDECQDVIDAIGNDRLPAVAYAVRASAERVRAILGDPHSVRRYARYDDEEMQVCMTDDGRPAAFHDLLAGSMGPVTVDAEIIIEPHNENPACGAWNLRPACTTGEGRRLTADDLMYSFGGRAYIPLTVETEPGKPLEGRTFIISSVAATAANRAVRAVISTKRALARFLAGEYCRKLDLDR